MKNYSDDRAFAFRFYANLVKRYKNSGNLLEIGCSFGHLLKRLEKKFNAHGIDKSPYAIKLSKNVCKGSKTSIGDAENLRFGNNSFDVVIALHVLEHIKNPDKAVNEVNRVLKKGGVFIFATPNISSPMRKIKGKNWFGYLDKTHVSMLEPKEWIEILEKRKFRLVKTFSDGFWDAPYAPFIPVMIQKPVFGFMTAVQFIFCLPFIPVRLGENLVVVAKKH